MTMDYNYIFLTYDALLEFASGRTFQSAEFSQSEQLCEILMRKDRKWSHPKIFIKHIENRGIIFYTHSIDKKRGLLYDLSTFSGFNQQSSESVITIFQKTINYAIHYFDKQPLAPCEYNLSGDIAIVYPYPFTATHNVEKVLLDKNSTKQNRKEQNFLVAYYFGTDTGTFVQTNLNKAVTDLLSISIVDNLKETEAVDSLIVSKIEKPNLSINSPRHYDEWNSYLTKTQRNFISRPLKGAERLEGPAGSGKTLSLILRCIYLLEKSVRDGNEYKIIFITHSLATKDRILDLFYAIYPTIDKYLETADRHPSVSILITTLQEWSKNNLGGNIVYDTELIDKDAGISKGYQLMMIEEAYTQLKCNEWKGYEIICSKDFVDFINKTQLSDILDLLQYEISVVIKGRADGNSEKYKQIERPALGLPLKTDEDKIFVLKVFEKYQQSLERSGLFDTDDITLSALGQLDTPIWKRRSIREGYDACFIDEAHLFNFNELSVFHYLNKPQLKNHIVYVLDKSQNSGEVGFTENELSTLEDVQTVKTKLNTIFRSSPEIVNLAFNILSSNVALFAHFENPLDYCSSSFTSEDDKKCIKPTYTLAATDEEMISRAISDVETYCNKHKVRRSDILIVTSDLQLLNILLKTLRNANKPHIELQSRNDYNTVKTAMNDNKYIVGGIDYVGGLEFDAVFILGVDKGRVPPEGKDKGNHYQFTNFAWHNRMYVAISRAKYYVALYGNSQNGYSAVLDTAKNNGIIDCE